jgi:hypothetical protein
VSVRPLFSSVILPSDAMSSSVFELKDGSSCSQHQPTDAGYQSNKNQPPTATCHAFAPSPNSWSSSNTPPSALSVQIGALYCNRVPCKGGHGLWGLPPSCGRLSGSSIAMMPGVQLPAQPDLQDLCSCLNKSVGMSLSVDLSLALLLR